MKTLYNKEETRVIGVDAGGTKTRAAAFDRDGNLVGEAFAGCGNLALSYDDAKTAVVSAVRGVWSDTCEYIVIGAAGASNAERAGRLSREMTERFGVKTDVMSDAELALNAAFGSTADGMLVIAGTGSVVFLRQNGTMLRAGGWGHLLGDGGSAYCTGMSALQTITRLRDNGTPDEILEHAVFDVLGIPDIGGLVPCVYAKERTKADFASIATAVDRLAENGHAVAENILWKSAELLANDAVSVLRRSGAASVDVALTGGHITHSVGLRRNFVRILSETSPCPLHFLETEADPTRAAYRIFYNL